MRLRFVSLGLALVLGAGSGLAQAPGVTPPPAADSTPAAPPSQPAPAPGTPPAEQPAAPQAQTAPALAPEAAPGQSAAPAESPAQPQPPAVAQPTPVAPAPDPANPTPPAQQAGRTTLFPEPGDPTDVQEGVLAAKPSVVLAGTSTWDEAFGNLKGVFSKMEDELKKAGIAPAGRPLTVFVDTDDNGFRYEAMIPIAQVPEGKTELTPEIKFGKTPEGKSFRFVHKDAYDEIDGTYETITAYLDAKDIVAKDAFIEEYASDFTDSQNTEFEVNIYVQPKE